MIKIFEQYRTFWGMMAFVAYFTMIVLVAMLF